MTKRTAEDASDAASSTNPHKHKRSRTGVHAALPTSDDAWRHKLERAKESNVRRAKTRQMYAKVKARVLAGEADAAPNRPEIAAPPRDETDEQLAPMHPERQARLDGDGEEGLNDKGEGEQGNDEHDPRGRRPGDPRPRKRPQPFQKAREEAAQRKAEAEVRRAECERQAAERDEKRVERARHQKAMARARRVDTHGGKVAAGGDSNRRKLGRESGVLLDRVRKFMGK